MMMAYSGICAFLLGTELRRFACPDWQPFSRNHVYSRVTQIYADSQLSHGH